MKNVLVIAPHMDDEVLGVGGSICKHVEAGDLVRVLFVANRVYDHTLDQSRLEIEEGHARMAQAVLGYQQIEFGRLPDENLGDHFVEVLRVIENSVAEFSPEIVYLNHRNDPHQDHKVVFQAGLICLRPISSLSSRIKRVACYEVPSSTEQSGPFVEQQFAPNYFIDISSYVKKKQEALGCYETEVRDFPHPRSAEGVEIVAKGRGMRANMHAAEAFMNLYEEWV